MTTSMQTWQTITQHRPVVDFFRDLFEHVGVRIDETGESFTAHHQGEKIDFTAGVNEAQVDYVVSISQAQVTRLAEHAESGRFDEAQQFRILRTLFTPATAATLRNPILSQRWLQWMIGVEDVTHVHLLSPVTSEPNISHTLICTGQQWLAISGLHGTARRVYELPLAAALEYHRRVFRALKQNRWSSWWEFGNWYRKWREGVSRKEGN